MEFVATVANGHGSMFRFVGAYFIKMLRRVEIFVARRSLEIMFDFTRYQKFGLH